MRSFKMIGMAALLLASTSLGACTSHGAIGGTPGTTDSTTQVSQIVQQIQATAVQVCSFQPTIATVTNIIGTFTSAGSVIGSVNDIAGQICSAISVPKSSRRGGAAPAFCTAGAMGEKCVAIHGKWVGK